MSDLGELYQEVLLDHNRRPRNFGALEEASHVAHGHNPLCGDKLTVYLKVRNGVVEGVNFTGSGCAVSQASASLMTEGLKGKSIDQVEAMFTKVHNLLTGKSTGAEDTEDLGKLRALSGISGFPIRVKCATLAWHTMHAALTEAADEISTE